jgi:hypothetical protein
MTEAKAQKPLLYEYFKKYTKILMEWHTLSQEQNASDNMGRNREMFCNAFLSNVLPERFSIRTGEIWDSKGHRTGQLDTIVVRDDMPSLAMFLSPLASNVYLAEGVFAVIEVKSNLTRAKLKESLATLRKVAKLELYHEGLAIIHDPESRLFLDRPLRCIFAYEGASWNTIVDELNKPENRDIVDVVAVLERGVLLSNDLFFRQKDEKVMFNILSGEASALAMLYFYIATYSSSFIARQVSVRPYFEPFNEWAENGNWTVAILKGDLE